MPRSATARDTSIRSYRAKRDFSVTREPTPGKRRRDAKAPIFVVQKHQAHRAGLHWDFRLEHDGVLWSWAVRKGPSLDPSVKRIAAHVEDHPLEYADFHGEIPKGEYGAGRVELWDRGTWQPLADAEKGMRKGELTFTLDGSRLNGRFHLVRMKPRPGQRSTQDNWLLFKGHDEAERAGADAATIESDTPPPKALRSTEAPAKGAVRGKLPQALKPQLASVAEKAPEGDAWVSEIKFDGYRLLAWLEHGKARLMTRNGLDWTDRLPAVAREVAKLKLGDALLDGELVALDDKGASSFPMLQAALSEGYDNTLNFYVFDLLHVNGWDLRGCSLVERKRVLRSVDSWRGMLRFSDHQRDDAPKMWRGACRMGLEGIICKQADAPYRSGRGHSWLKVKCTGREELIVLGWTPPRGSRTGLGSPHLGYYDGKGGLHYAGGVGTGFSDDELSRLAQRLRKLAAGAPKGLLVGGDEPLDNAIRWVKPELVAEVRLTSWSGSGRVRQSVYLGLREDKRAKEVVREPADAKSQRKRMTPRQPRNARAPMVVTPPRRSGDQVAGVTLTHPDRELWPGVTKRQLADYWQAVAEIALPGVAGRPLAIVRCPDGIEGERFFQKHGHGTMPAAVRNGEAGGQPYLAIDDMAGLIAMAQMSALELHTWGATEADPLHPDRIVFDLDPGEGVTFGDVVRAAHDIRERLEKLDLATFCRTTGGKGLHVVVPLKPVADWDVVKPFCKAFAEAISEEKPDRYLSTVRKADRRGRILIDWLRNGLGATAIASFSTRARPGATVATPLAWKEVNARLDLAKFNLKTIPGRLAKLRSDPWAAFDDSRKSLPDPGAADVRVSGR
jgi:bifunctional non-homologous end joining protein LigD